MNKKKVREISRAIAPLDLKWSTLSRTDTVDRESIECMRDAGCIEIKFGIESGSERILHAMGKRTTRAEIVRAVQMTHDIGVGVKAFIIHGYPGENLESTRETIALLRELSGMISRITLFRFVPLPGSPVFETHGNLLRSMGDDWKKSHIHHNPHHWWGTEADFAEVQAGYEELRAFIDQRWGL